MQIKLFTLPQLILASNILTPLTNNDRFVISLTIQADVSNNAAIYVGGQDLTSNTGFQLAAGDSILIEPPSGNSAAPEINLRGVFALATTTGQKIRVTYMAIE